MLGWKRLGHERRLEARIVNDADDLVICCRNRAEEALETMRDMMSKLRLTVNEAKTRVCSLPEERFDFLGYTFGQCYWPKTGRAYLGTVPSKKRISRICAAISEETGRNKTLLNQRAVVETLNRMMIGILSPPAKRTDHLLNQPDISCATNTIRHCELINCIGNARINGPF